jgi:hypothetical protein
MTAEQISIYFGMSTRRVQQLSKAGMLPKVARDDYDLAACTRAYIAHLKKWQSATEFPVSMADLARCCGTSQAKISVLVRMKIIPKLGRGRYDLATGVQAFIRHLKPEGSSNESA